MLHRRFTYGEDRSKFTNLQGGKRASPLTCSCGNQVSRRQQVCSLERCLVRMGCY